jgi:peptidyl-tRNA hydrolase, PTH1 family
VPWLVAGLGNSGDRYSKTRHNLGAMVVDELAGGAGERLRKVRFLPAEIAEIRESGTPVILARSLRFMNESGPAYASLARKRGIEPSDVIAVHDELDLAPGSLQVRLGGGTAGHNGLRSLQQALGSPEFYRVRIGIGRPPGRQDPADFVLEPIPKRMESELAILVGEAADAVRCLIAEGLPAAQDRFNRKGSGV